MSYAGNTDKQQKPHKLGQNEQNSYLLKLSRLIIFQILSAAIFATVGRYYFQESFDLNGFYVGVVYSLIANILYGVISRAVLSTKPSAFQALLAVGIKIPLLFGFVFLIAYEGGLYMLSAIAGLLSFIPAAFLQGLFEVNNPVE